MPVPVSFCPISAIFQYFTDTGIILAGGKINTYVAGSTTPTATYTDSTGVTENENPIILLSNGRLPNAQIWQPQGALIKIIVTDANNVQLGPVFDQIGGINDPTLPGSLSNPASGSGADLVANAVRSYDLFSSMRSANVPVLATGQTLEVVVQGGITLGDTLSGLFRWSASSTAADDGLNVIKPTSLSGPGRYLRQTPISVTPTGTLIISSNGVNVDVYALSGSPLAAATVNLTIAAGVVIYSLGARSPALDFRGFASSSTINVVNNGLVVGAGGRGGIGGAINRQGDVDMSWGGQPGKDAGNAIEGPGTGVTFNITNAAGFIWGGGGGGGGGGVSADDGGNLAAGGGGGGGSGYGLGGNPNGLVDTEGFALALAAAGTDGFFLASGAAANGVGGVGTSVNSAAGGTGGDGGAFGAAGTVGASPTGFNRDIAGGAAGGAGKAINLNGGVATFVSGSGSPNVKGAVS